MELILHLENFNKSLSFNKSNKTKLHDVLPEMEIFFQLCYPKFPNETDEENESLTMEDNKFVWNCHGVYARTGYARVPSRGGIWEWARRAPGRLRLRDPPPPTDPPTQDYRLPGFLYRQTDRV